ncbi:hypothetical protein WMF45_19055 [Sorangium sp. So ce448]|uniref:hypothetical protein n=1 Tax=Sorangium sp. So ce448 TaxID=3133314 RepID=UPI003F63E444
MSHDDDDDKDESDDKEHDESRSRVDLAKELTGGEDDSIIVASDDGRIFRLAKERWQNTDFEIRGPAKKYVENRYLKRGVVAANMPINIVEPFFACYLLNIAMINKKIPSRE